MKKWKPCSHGAECQRRSFWGHLVLGVAVLIQLVVLGGYVRFFTGPSAGFSIYEARPGQNQMLAVPVTADAAPWRASRTNPTVIRRINGHSLLEVPRGTAYDARVREWLDLTPGGTNTFLVVQKGRLVELTLPVERPRLDVWFSNPSAYFQALGLLYLACGALVWWRRHADRAALPLLMFTAVASFQMVVPAADVALGYVQGAARYVVLPLYGAAGMGLTLAFTGFFARPIARLASKLVLGVSLALLAFLAVCGALLSRAYVEYEPWLEMGNAATGLHLSASVLAMVGFCWAASRPPHPLGLRRRAAVMAKAILVAFAIPSLYLAVSAFLPDAAQGPMSTVVLVSMATFPLMLAYAIVRHQMFDLRIVVRQGVVYGGLSLLVTLVYLGVVVASVKGLDRHAESPVVIGLAAVVFVLLASVLKLKVQNAVDRLVFRARYVYADAIATASEQLVRARSIAGITDSVRVALIDSMQLSRAYFAVREGHDEEGLRCFVLGNRPDPRNGRVFPQLPATLRSALLKPVGRALSTGRVATAYDSSAASAQSAHWGGADVQNGEEEHGEATFWSHFGIEAIVPLTVSESDAADRVVGLLVLGPKLSEQQLDPEDQKLLSTLANQLVVALENAHAFEVIEELKSGLEDQVEARTRELSDAIETLRAAQSHLVESQKQAMLGRLVAGIVHEVNSPLGALRSSADTIRRSLARAKGFVQQQPSPDAGRVLRAIDTGEELTHLIRSGSSRIGALMTSLSSFISLDQAEYRTFDVREGLQSALTLLEPQLGSGVRVEPVLASDPVSVRGNVAKLNQVFLNLLQNAITAVEGRGRVRISAARRAGWVEIEIEDDGCGISSDRLDKLFDFAFTTKSSGRIGLGLGLPASKRAVEELGGTLTLLSEPGRGTSVRVMLPAATGVDSQPPLAPIEPSKPMVGLPTDAGPVGRLDPPPD